MCWKLELFELQSIGFCIIHFLWQIITGTDFLRMKEHNTLQDHYKILEVSPQASRKDILRARNKLLLKYHPDVNLENEIEAKEQTLKILFAAEVLLDEKSRAEYDRVYRETQQPTEKASGGWPSPASERHGYRKRNFNPIVCDSCGHENYPYRNYCLYCGTGIGSNPEPFHRANIDLNSILFQQGFRGKASSLLGPHPYFALISIVLGFLLIAAIFIPLVFFLLNIPHIFPGIGDN